MAVYGPFYSQESVSKLVKDLEEKWFVESDSRKTNV